jgi:hypothetical protein
MKRLATQTFTEIGGIYTKDPSLEERSIAGAGNFEFLREIY